MKKLTLFFAALFCMAAVSAKTLYLIPEGAWVQNNERYSVYCFNDSGDGWVSMTKVPGGKAFVATVDDAKYHTIIFCRMNGSTTENNWDNKWDQTANLKLSEATGDCYTMPAATWSTYTLPVITPTTVRLKKPADWAKVYIYAWGVGANTKTWPGTELTEEDGWYTHTLDVSDQGQTSFLFNDGTNQTVDVADIKASTCYELGTKGSDGKFALNPTDCPSIVYDLDGGKILPATNEELYHLIASYYPTFAQKGRVLQAFDHANTGNTIATFLQDNTNKMMTDATSEYKWLGDYMISKEPSLGGADITNSNWTYSLQRFLYCRTTVETSSTASYGERTYGKGDWSANGQPAAWQAVCADVEFVLPTSTTNLGYGYTWNFLLPSAVKDGYTFKGWKDENGDIVTEVPAKQLEATFTAQWEKKGTTSIENAEVEQFSVRKVFENGQIVIIKDGVRYNVLGTVIR